jgi:hypothetical protein
MMTCNATENNKHQAGINRYFRKHKMYKIVAGGEGKQYAARWSNIRAAHR